MPAPQATKLDANQVLKHSFKEDTGELRVSAVVNATIGTVTVAIDASNGDNIAIADSTGTNFLDVNADGSIDVKGPLTDAELRNSPVPVLAALPVGASTSALQTTGNSSLSSIDTKLTTTNSTLSNIYSNIGNIRALTFATDKVDVSGSSVSVSNFPATQAVTQSGTWNVGITGTPNVAVTSTVGLTNAELRASEVPVSVASLPLPTGASTSALQVSGNTILSDILTAVGGGGTGGGSSANTDILGSLYTGQQNNQIEINFEITANPDLITNTTTSTGSITISNGHTLYATGTGVTSSAKGVSVKANAYRPLNESYSGFSAAFTTPTAASSYQRIGLYDTSNGFFIGFEGLTFGVTKRAAGVDSFIPRASFNTDLLTGAVDSRFTRDGVPEALNLNLSNLFRIRFAWLGSAPIYFEVFSPDGAWVIFHKIKQPNLSLNPSINNPDLPMTIDVSKSASNATNLIMYTACWAAGTTSVFTKITDTLTDQTLAALTRSAITGKKES